MDELSELLQVRREKLAHWVAKGVDPFGGAFPGTEASADLIANYDETRPVRAAGRLVGLRDMGKSIFAHILDHKGKIQVYFQKAALAESFDDIKFLDLGDFIGVDGTLFTTKTGEKSIRVSAFQLLSKSLRPLPDKWHGLSDTEQRYRQRYLDLIVTEEARRVMQLRSQITRETRNFLEARGFVEVETPMMQPIAGGAAAQPFKTHHNALNIPLFLRIAPELYLKRLLVGGYEKVFEINRNFRNEGTSRKHNPEFTMLEAYWAYADFEEMAKLVEDMISTIAQKCLGTVVVGPNQINLATPWPRKKYRDCIREVAGADWFELTPEQRRTKAQELGVEIGAELSDHEVSNQIFEKLVEAKQMQPLFVTHLPKELVPLAKQNKEDPSVVDVYELIINGQEISPGYSELNDPIIQRERLESQVGDEKQNLDEDFLLAMEHGMPPAGGIGLGMDRLAILLTGVESIRDVILFPLMKPKG
jgi:lysyl-tRNA synthetase class 2